MRERVQSRKQEVWDEGFRWMLSGCTQGKLGVASQEPGSIIVAGVGDEAGARGGAQECSVQRTSKTISTIMWQVKKLKKYFLFMIKH